MTGFNIARTCVVGLLLAIVALGADPAAAAGAPLLMEGKQTIFQRVLTRPGASLVQQPGAADGRAQPALSRFYVYGRKTVGNTEWVEVGGGVHGKVEGWLDANATLPWKQQMALTFTNPANRERTLMFDSREQLMDLLLAEDPGVASAPLREAVEAGKPAPGVVSIEPREYIDFSKQFYLLPILEAEEVVTHQGYVRALQIASVTEEEGVDPTAAAAQSGGASGATSAQQTSGQQSSGEAAALRSFSATVTFVIDSTISMGPYIDRVREAVRRIYDRIEQANLLDQIKFGLIAYRSNIEKAPGLQYVSKVFVDPNAVEGGEDFLNKVAGLGPADVSSARFDEDAYAGVMTALETVDWSAFGGRYLVLITDAGALEGSDALSGTRLGAEQVRLEAEELGVAIYALHLKTPQGRNNHASAERQYEALSYNKVLQKPLYYPVESGSVAAFGSVVDQLGAAIVEQVEAAAMGEEAAGSARTASGAAPSQPASAPGTNDGSEDVAAQIKADARLLGHAMQLAYLGRQQGTEAPDLFKAWLADRAFGNFAVPTTEVRVLLTKNQLSDLRDVVKAILDAGEQSQDPDAVSTADFFDLLRSSAAHLARDPNQLSNPDAARLGELGLLGEYLDDLPYKSQVMTLTADEWEQWSISQQEDLLDTLRRKLRHYQIYHDDSDRWVSLGGTGDPGEAVYPVPIDALP